MPSLLQHLKLAWTGFTLKNKAQKKVFTAAVKLMHDVEREYRQIVGACGKPVQPEGLLRARLFAIYFPMSIMALVGGEEKHAEAETVYRLLIPLAFEGIPMIPVEKNQIAQAMLQEQTRSLVSEFRNVGSGQFALAALYGVALVGSIGPIPDDGVVGGENITTVLGRVTGQCLAVWAALYKTLAQGPMQVYTEGFAPTERDKKPFGEE